MEFFESLFLFAIVLAVPKLRRAFFLAPSEARRVGERSGVGRLLFFDFAKGIAIIAVILIHSMYLFVGRYPDYDPYWLDVINNLSRFAVGFFFIASGALLTSGLTKKKIIRVFVPYVLFCIVVGLFQNKPLDLVIGGIFRGDLLPPYYFIPVLFQFYLLFPLLNKLRHHKYFLLGSILLSYLAYATPALSYIAGVPTFGPFLFLFTFGMAFSERLKLEKPFGNINAWLLIIPIYVGLQFMLPGHYYNSRFFYAPALFVTLHYLWTRFSAVRKVEVLQTLGRLSLWIYLIHFSVESFFVNLFVYDFSYSVYFYILLITVLTVVGSGTGAYLVSKFYKNINKH